MASDSDSDSCDGADWGGVLDLLDTCAASETADDGGLFREALTQAHSQHAAEQHKSWLVEVTATLIR